jgi:hypothetical protein
LQLLVLASTLSFAVVGGVVGMRLLLLARRTRQLPELTIGLGLVLIAPLGYPLMLVATVPGFFPLATARMLYALAMALTSVGCASIFVFTWRVFRRDAAWARALACCAIVVLLVQAVANSVLAFVVPTLEMMNQLNLWFLIRQLAMLLSYGWTAFESLRYFGLLRRRMRLGLADPVLASRILLWGVAGLLSFGAAATRAAIVATGGDPLHSAAAPLAIGAGGFLVSLALYLAFIPPAPYRRWVGRRGAAAHA